MIFMAVCLDDAPAVHAPAASVDDVVHASPDDDDDDLTTNDDDKEATTTTDRVKAVLLPPPPQPSSLEKETLKSETTTKLVELKVELLPPSPLLSSSSAASVSTSSSNFSSSLTSSSSSISPTPQQQTKPQEEQCIISSSEAEDHHYTSLTTITPTSLAANNSEPAITITSKPPQTPSKSSRSRSKRKAPAPKAAAVVVVADSKPIAKSRRGSSKVGRQKVAVKIEPQTPTGATSTQVASASAAITASVDNSSSSSSCFRRFYLQRQPDGTTSLLFVPAANELNKGSKQHPNNNHIPTSIIPRSGQPSLLILGEPSSTTTTTSSTPVDPLAVPPLQQQQQQPATLLMRIEKSSLVAPLVTLLDGPSSAPSTTTTATSAAHVRSITDLLQPSSSSTTFPAGLAGKVLLSPTLTSNNANNGNMRFTNNFPQPQPQQSQSRAILSAHKQQQQQQQQLASPPPMMAASKFLDSEVLNEGGSNIVLPPVETILGTGNGNHQQHLFQPQLSEEYYALPDFGNTASLLDSDLFFEDEDLAYVPYGNCNVDATEDGEDGGCYADLISTSLTSPSSSSVTSSPLLTSAPFNVSSSSSGAAHDDLGKQSGSNSNSSFLHSTTITTTATTSANNGAHEVYGGSYAAVEDMFEYGGGSCAMQTALMTCDNDPLISGNDISLKSSGGGGSGSTMANSGPFNRVHSSHSVSTTIPIPSSGAFFASTSASSSSGNIGGSLPTYLIANDYAATMTSNGAFFESAVKEEFVAEGQDEDEDEDDSKTVVGWLTESANGIALFQSGQNNNNSAMIDLNGLQQQQQNSLISSTSSPTMLNGKQQQQQNFWAYDNGQNGLLTGEDNIVSSSSLVMSAAAAAAAEMDDASPEIETILLNGTNAVGGGGGRRLNSSPPKLSSSLPSGGFKSPNILKMQNQQQMLHLKKPFFVNHHQQQQNGHQAPLLTGLLQASTSANVNELLRTGNGPAHINLNGGLVSANGGAQLISGKSGRGGKAMFNGIGIGTGIGNNNCPTLATLIASGSGSSAPSSSSSSSGNLLSSSLPSISALRNGVPSMATLLQQQQQQQPAQHHQVNMLGALNNNNNNNINNRNRNNSMSTDYSVSSHDEGFGSQPDEDDPGLLSDQGSDTGSLMDGMMEMMNVDGGVEGALDASDLIGDDVNDLFFGHSNSNAGGSSLGLNAFAGQMLNNSSSTSADLLAIPGPSSSASSIVIKQEILEGEPMWCPTTSTAASSSSSGNVQHRSAADIFNNSVANNGKHLIQQQQQQYHHQQSMDEGGGDEEEEGGSMIAGGSEDAEADEEEDDDDESFYGDYEMSDLIGASTSDDQNNKWSLNMGRSRKGTEKRYFWQYNVQSKGPKGPRYATGANSASASAGGERGVSGDEEEDPHVFNEIADPVFAPDCQVEGVKHSGKARRGDGNDLTPNPKKLLMIGLELKKLSKVINELTPVTEVPAQSRNKSRKEKNKLASRACRLKKKAQHEANKIKLRGLYLEHTKANRQIAALRKVVEGCVKMARSGGQKGGSAPFYIAVDGASYQVAGPPASSVRSLESIVEEVAIRHQTVQEVAGRTADYVNGVLDNVTMGNFGGGIDNV